MAIQLFTTVRQWWQERTVQEQRMLTIGGIVVAILILYYAIITPLQEANANALQQLQYNQSLASWMQPRVAKLAGQTPASAPKKIDPSALLSTLDNAVKQTSFAGTVTEVSQNGKNGVQIRFKTVPLNRLLVWLAEQQTQYGIQVTQFQAQQTPRTTNSPIPNTADVTVVLGLKSGN